MTVTSYSKAGSLILSQPRTLTLLMLGLLTMPCVYGDDVTSIETSGQSSRAVPSWLQRWSRVNQRSSSLVKSVFREVVAETRKSTVRIFCDGKKVALGAVVRADGFVLTKASELHGEIKCELADGRTVPGIIIGIRDDFDLAIVKVAASDLTPISWSDDAEPVPGSWLATPGQASIPVAIGVVSARSRKIEPPRGVLGVLLGMTDRGPAITSVVPDSGAQKAGLRKADVVTRVDGRSVVDVADLISRIQTLRPGAKIKLDIIRDGSAHLVVAELGRATITEEGQRAEFQKTLGRQLSKRSAGFPTALQHDTVLRPSDCGGPVVNLDGEVVGINIASADRVTSYAITAASVRPLLPKLLSGELAPRDSRLQWQVFQAEATKLRLAIRQATEHLKQLRDHVTRVAEVGRTAKTTVQQNENDTAAKKTFADAREHYKRLTFEISKTNDNIAALNRQLAELPASKFALASD